MSVGPVLPYIPLTPTAYQVNGTLLDTQPTIMTAPRSTEQIVHIGASFTLGFASTSTATRSLLATGTIVTLQFALHDGFLVSGPVLVQSGLVGSFFWAFCTLTQDIRPYRWVITVQTP